LLSIKEAVNDSLAAPFVSFLITVSDWFGLWFLTRENHRAQYNLMNMYNSSYY